MATVADEPLADQMHQRMMYIIRQQAVDVNPLWSELFRIICDVVAEEIEKSRAAKPTGTGQY